LTTAEKQRPVTGEIRTLERRANQRIFVQVGVSMVSSTQLYTGLTGDISTGGVFVATWQEFPIGIELDLDLTLPNGTVRTRAVVRWRREPSKDAPDIPPGVGVGFVNMDPNARRLLHEFCAAREPMFYESDDGS
jgi:uncharacterized protein (TIGR02266 family)